MLYYFYDFIGWAAHQTVSSVACDSDPKMAALQTVETRVRTQRYRLDAEEVSNIFGWMDLAKVLSRFGSLMV